MKHYDLIVLGGGSAGYAGARTGVELGKSVAVVDGSKELGGLCILRGCMPSKTLIYSAEVLHLAQNGKKFGLNIPQATADFPALHQRKKTVIGEFQEYREEQLKDGRFDLYQQFGRFSGEKEMTLNDGTVLTADKILISTGSKISVPPVPGLSELPVLTSDEILELDRKLDSVIVLGGGVVACELAQFLSRTGSEVTQIQRSPNLLKSMSPEVSQVVKTAFEAEGMKVYTDTSNLSLQKTDNGYAATFEQDGQTTTVEATEIVNALGRTPATDSLNLSAPGVELRRSGHIVADEYQQTSHPDIFAAGDCAGPHEVVHVAIIQGECAVKKAFGQDPDPMDYDPLLTVVFTDPQAAVVGLSETELTQRGIPFITESYPFDDHGKSILMEAKFGYVKVIAHKETGVVLGAECVGKDAGELIHSMSVAVGLKAKVQDLIKVHWYHPTLSEIWTYPLEDLAEEITA